MVWGMVMCWVRFRATVGVGSTVRVRVSKVLGSQKSWDRVRPFVWVRFVYRDRVMLGGYI